MLIEGFNYKIYNELICVFSDISKIFEASKNRELFKKIIYSKNIFIPNYIYLKLTSDDLKEKVNLIYSNLLKQNIKIIPIISKNYPKNLINIYNPPLAIFVYGNIQFNSKKCIYLYEDNLSKFGKKVYKYFSYYMKNKMTSIGKNNCDVILKYENIFNLNYINDKNCNKIIIPYNKDYLELEILLGIVDYILIIEARYNEETKNIVNNIIESGKEVLVVPGNIFNKNHYFSNYLIQEGATVLLNKKDIDNFI